MKKKQHLEICQLELQFKINKFTNSKMTPHIIVQLAESNIVMQQ